MGTRHRNVRRTQKAPTIRARKVEADPTLEVIVTTQTVPTTTPHPTLTPMEVVDIKPTVSMDTYPTFRSWQKQVLVDLMIVITCWSEIQELRVT